MFYASQYDDGRAGASLGAGRSSACAGSAGLFLIIVAMGPALLPTRHSLATIDDSPLERWTLRPYYDRRSPEDPSAKEVMELHIVRAISGIGITAPKESAQVFLFKGLAFCPGLLPCKAGSEGGSVADRR